MTRCWLALVPEAASGASAQAQVLGADCRAAGWLAVWRQRAKPVRAARRVDERIVDPGGAHFEGSITVARGAGVTRLADDPFARIFPAHILRVGAGVLGVTAAPAGPCIERYGSANPWPWDHFDLGDGA